MKIKFSHRYEKMPKEFEKTMLMQLFVDDVKNFSELFIKWDTLYWGEKTAEYYPLPKGKVIVLVLITGARGQVWTTIRRWTPQKEKYYRSMLMQDVEVEIQ